MSRASNGEVGRQVAWQALTSVDHDQPASTHAPWPPRCGAPWPPRCPRWSRPRPSRSSRRSRPPSPTRRPSPSRSRSRPSPNRSRTRSRRRCPPRRSRSLRGKGGHDREVEPRSWSPGRGWMWSEEAWMRFMEARLPQHHLSNMAHPSKQAPMRSLTRSHHKQLEPG